MRNMVRHFGMTVVVFAAVVFILSQGVFAQSLGGESPVPAAALLPPDQLQKFQDDQSKKENQTQGGTASSIGQSGKAEQAGQKDIPPKATATCSDYYHFGSVQVSVQSTTDVKAGMRIDFSGTMLNANSYPIVDGSVYAKVFRKQTVSDQAHQNGGFLVDQFVVRNGITLAANESRPISFSWKVPIWAESGEYEIAMFFYTADRFNLLGLTFTDDIVGNKAQFNVVGNTIGSVAFDKNNVKLNGALYNFAAFPSHFQKDASVKTEVQLRNTTKEDENVVLTWTLYNWDSLRKENQIDQKQETVSLKAGETKSLSYETTKYTGAVSYLVVEAVANDMKSILDIRYIRDGIAETRINFPSIMKFPLQAGEQNTVFSCAHSTNLPLVGNSELTLDLKDANGKLIHSYRYAGDISGTMMAVKDDFVPEKTYSNFILTATLKKDGSVVDTLDQQYDCTKIDKNLCPDDATKLASGSSIFSIVSAQPKTVLYMIFLSVLVVLGGFIGWTKLRRK